ncbi:MAG: DUF72 domain-containing protein [Planctomycetes bacterium]|nr:DUF72 domain-containing protein [Planctomycetota bacterium]
METSEDQQQSVKEAIRIGVAGWSYPDWRGLVYAQSRSSRGGGGKGGEKGAELALMAGLFDCVEINNTFYRTPAAPMAAGWLKAVAHRPGFTFTAKVPKELTHATEASPQAVAAGARQLLEGLKPLIEAGRLEMLLAQFPPSFRDSEPARRRIQAVVEALHPLPVAVEIRNCSFLRPGGGFLPFLERLGAGFVNVDLPPGRDQLPPTTINTSAFGYARFHGRNAAAWFDRLAGRDQKYDYLYSEAELREWVPRLLLLASRARKVYAIANNHYQGKAPANALELLALLGRALPPIPAGLLALYPQLRKLQAGAERAREEEGRREGAQP